MTTTKPHPSGTGFRRFFIAVQVMLVLAWCGLLTDTLSHVCFWLLAITIALLFFVLPWFWSNLRWVALVGWLLAAVSVLTLCLLRQRADAVTETQIPLAHTVPRAKVPCTHDDSTAAVPIGKRVMAKRQQCSS